MAVRYYPNEIKMQSVVLGKGAKLDKIDATGVSYTIVDNDAKVWRAVYNDLAELMPKGEEGLSPGDVLVYYNGRVIRTDNFQDRRVIRDNGI